MKKLSECRVLIVDDTRANIDILVEGLKADHKLSLAFNGETALQIATRTPPDLVLLDIMMPGLDGYEVCRRMRRMPELAEVPIMFLSSLEEVQDKARGFEAGANDYLTKPFEMLEVKARVRALLKAKAYSDAAKEQMAGELRIAHEIQMGMLPHDFTAVEAAYGVEFGARLEPAREVGGDLYGVCAAGAEHLLVFLGDVSGKGIPASLFMVRAISLARLLAREIREPDRILARLNDELSDENPSGMFVTFLCAVFEPKTGRLTLANGGHCSPVLLRSGEPPQRLTPHIGTALGFEPAIVFPRTELNLLPGDTLLLYTDGVTEAFDPREELYGNDRLLADAAGLTGQSAPEIAAGLLRKIRAFAGDAPQSDDIAILTLKVKAATAPSSAGDAVRLELKATPDEVGRALETFQKFAQDHGLPEKMAFHLALALDECASNIVNYALRRDPEQKFQVTIQPVPGAVVLEFRDRGPRFDPVAAGKEPAAAEDDDRLGGWGLQLVRRHMDEIIYVREGDENVLRLTKRFVPGDNHRDFPETTHQP